MIHSSIWSLMILYLLPLLPKLIYFLISIIWAGDIIRRENMLGSFTQLWTGYPHLEMSYMFKFYFVVQISYWLHQFPELYFQKVRKEEMRRRVTYSSLYLSFFVATYLLNLTRIAVVLSFL